MQPLPRFDADTWLLLLNPVSGRGSGLRRRAGIEAALAAQGLRCHTQVSEYAGHSVALVRAALAAGCRRLLIAGGDGSVSEAVNGIFSQDQVAPAQVRLALLPIGTGNDWARGLGLPQRIDDVARLLGNHRLRALDVGRIDFPETGARRYFINVAGGGFDAQVIERMPSRRFGRLAYVIGLLRGLAAYRPLPLRLEAASGPAHAQAFVLFACLGRYCGGGMLVAPQAQSDDGQLDFTLIHHMSRLRVLHALPRLFDGSLLAHPRVQAWCGREAHLAAPPGTAIQADGELVGHAPVRFSVLPQALPVVVPQSGPA